MSKKANEGEGRDRDEKGREGREEEKWKGGGSNAYIRDAHTLFDILHLMSTLAT